MAEDSFEAMARVAAEDATSATKKRIERERRLQTRSRRIRWACRLIIVLAGGGGIALFYFEKVGGFALLLLLVALLAAVVLFFMGGFAPGRVRLLLSEREQRQLDD